MNWFLLQNVRINLQKLFVFFSNVYDIAQSFELKSVLQELFAYVCISKAKGQTRMYFQFNLAENKLVIEKIAKVLDEFD